MMTSYTILFLILSINQVCCTITDNDVCVKDENGVLDCEIEPTLFRLQPKQVGESEEINLAGQNYMLKTLSIRPTIFEVQDFLSDSECSHLIGLAEAEGLEESVTRKDQSGRGIVLRDHNKDKQLSLDEMMLTIEDSFDIYPTEDDIIRLYADLKLDKNGDNMITPSELNSVEPSDIAQYLAKFAKKNPAKRSRYSKQTWIYPDKSTDPVFKEIQTRVQELTRLDPILITKSDFQVVNYGVDGHYNAHHDSSRLDSKVPCCTRHRGEPCRICRFATVLMYLNDVEEGGETAFPVADNETLDSTTFIKNHQMNLVRFCPDANVKVVPEKRKVVLWYNHEIDAATGWLGEMDDFTWHGGCPVTKGNKWIANFWIKVTDDRTESLSPYH